jgi:hypothetical protein
MSQIINMEELTTELRRLNLDANYYMSGGGNGTIYIGEADEEGFFHFAIGTSQYSTATAYLEELFWGRDDKSGQAPYFQTSKHVSIPLLAEIILGDYQREMGK